MNISELIDRRGVLLVRLDARMEEATALLDSRLILRLVEATLGRRTVDSGATGAVNLVCFQLDPDEAHDLFRHFGVPEPASNAAYSPIPIATLRAAVSSAIGPGSSWRWSVSLRLFATSRP